MASLATMWTKRAGCVEFFFVRQGKLIEALMSTFHTPIIIQTGILDLCGAVLEENHLIPNEIPDPLKI